MIEMERWKGGFFVGTKHLPHFRFKLWQESANLRHIINVECRFHCVNRIHIEHKPTFTSRIQIKTFNKTVQVSRRLFRQQNKVLFVYYYGHVLLFSMLFVFVCFSNFASKACSRSLIVIWAIQCAFVVISLKRFVRLPKRWREGEWKRAVERTRGAKD